MRLKTEDDRLMRTRSAWVCFVFGLLTLFSSLPSQAGEPLYTLSAAVTEAHPQDATFSAHFKHPATGEPLEYLFHVTEHTGMNGLKQVKELKRNDLLQIDYFKSDGKLIVEYMARMRMKGVPEGLEKFNPVEFLKNKPQAE